MKCQLWGKKEEDSKKKNVVIFAAVNDNLVHLQFTIYESTHSHVCHPYGYIM